MKSIILVIALAATSLAAPATSPNAVKAADEKRGFQLGRQINKRLVYVGAGEEGEPAEEKRAFTLTYVEAGEEGESTEEKRAFALTYVEAGEEGEGSEEK